MWISAASPTTIEAKDTDEEATNWVVFVGTYNPIALTAGDTEHF